MSKFIESVAGKVLEVIYGHYAGPKHVAACSQCKETVVEQPLYRCTECVQLGNCCESCVKKCHVHSPFHAVEVWNPSQRFWRRLSLSELDVVLHLGHGGARCPNFTGSPRPTTIVHEQGVHTFKVQYCKCRRRPSDGTGEEERGNGGLDDRAQVSEVTQVLDAGFWPATWTTPQTLFTQQVLRDFSLLSNIAHVNAHDYMKFLTRVTDNVDPKSADVSASVCFVCSLLRRVFRTDAGSFLPP